MSEKSSLQEFIHISQLQAIQDSFAKAVGISSVIFSSEGEPVTHFANPTGFCSLIQSTEEGKKRCFQSFMEMSQKALELKEPDILYCFACGAHFVAPIMVDGEHKGTMFAGQFIPQELSSEQLKELEKTAVQIQLDPQLLVEEARKLRVIEADSAWNYSSLLFQVVRVIAALVERTKRLNQAKAALQNANKELEVRVQKRTAELVKKNKQLKREIQERKWAAKALKEERNKAQKYLDITGVMIVAVDAAGDVILINKKGCEILEYEQGEIVGKSWFDNFLPERMRDEVKGVSLKLLAGEVEPVEYYENQVLTKNGQERLIAWHNTVLRDEAGDIIGHLSSGGDITEHRQTEEALRESEQRYRTLLENLPQKIFHKDKDSVYLSCNENYASDLKIKPKEIKGKTDYDFFPQELAEKYRMNDRRTVTLGNTEEFEEKYIQNGQEMWVQTVKTPVKDADGSITGVLGIFWDITEKKKAEEENKRLQAQVFQSEKMASIGQLAAGVAHEINNPTGFVSSNLKTLSDYHNDISSLVEQYRKLTTDLRQTMATAGYPVSVSEQLERIAELEAEADIDFVLNDISDLVKESREGTERIKKIVLDLKDFAHPGEDKPRFADINRNMESTLNVVWNELKYKATVTKDYGDLPEVECYPQQLNQVFMNLLVNAAQAMEKQGEIRIVTRADDGYVEIRISDTGKGIPKENLSKIFDPFFTTKEVGKGTGLGLNVAYNIIKKHNGTIDVESTVGKGTMFTIRIPVQKEV
jgi:two-component system NtrC family sensor kinase